MRDSLEESRRAAARAGEHRRRGSWVWGLGLVMAAGALALASPSRAALPIDDFSSVQGVVLSSEDASAAGAAAAPAAIGGERDIEIERVSGSGGADVNVNGGVPPQGQLLFSSGIGTETVLRIVWDGEDLDAEAVDPTGLGEVDLSDGGALDAFAIEMDIDLATILSLRVYDASDATGQTWSEAIVPVLPTGGDFAVVEVLFDEFTESGPLGAADFGNAGAIRLEVAGVPSLDLRLDSVQVVPEPAAASLAGLTTLALLARGRRRSGGR